MKLLALSFTVVLALAHPAHGQEAAGAPPVQPTLRTFFTDLAGDVRRLPSNAAGLSVAAGGILSAALSPLDDNLSDWDPNTVSRAGQWIGNPFVLAGATLAVYGAGAWKGKARVRHLAADALRAQALALGLTSGLKYTVQRERPDESSQDSFPSGHASQTFATATVVARHLGIKAGIPAYATAAFVSISRINQHRHWVSDVAFGAGLGVAVGWNGKAHSSNWALAPAASRTRIALNISRVSVP
jgi:membrane-associated phospholipid phosphatase